MMTRRLKKNGPPLKDPSLYKIEGLYQCPLCHLLQMEPEEFLQHVTECQRSAMALLSSEEEPEEQEKVDVHARKELLFKDKQKKKKGQIAPLQIDENINTDSENEERASAKSISAKRLSLDDEVIEVDGQVYNIKGILAGLFCSDGLLDDGQGIHERRTDEVSSTRKRLRKKVIVKIFMKCEICGKVFRSKKSFTKHKKTHPVEKSKKHGCSDCHKSYFSLQNLAIHCMTHRGDKPYNCEICGAMFTEQSYLNTHEQLHEDNPAYSCSDCGKQFHHGSDISRHVVVHSDGTTSFCLVCGKVFVHMENLTSHLYSHSKLEVRCQLCRKRFKKKSELFSHYRTHLKVKPFKCYVCGSSFKKYSSKITHLKTHYSRSLRFTCRVCKVRFARNKSLQHHVLQAHNRQLEKSSKDINNEYTLNASKSSLKLKIKLTAGVGNKRNGKIKKGGKSHQESGVPVLNVPVTAVVVSDISNTGSENDKIVMHLKRKNEETSFVPFKKRKMKGDYASKLEEAVEEEEEENIHVRKRLEMKSASRNIRHVETDPQGTEDEEGDDNTDSYSVSSNSDDEKTMLRTIPKRMTTKPFRWDEEEMEEEKSAESGPTQFSESNEKSSNNSSSEVCRHSPSASNSGCKKEQTNVGLTKSVQETPNVVSYHQDSSKAATDSDDDDDDDDFNNLQIDLSPSPHLQTSPEQQPTSADVNQKPFTCAVCGKSFQKKQYLTAHAISHSDAKPFTCVHCSKSFARKPTMRTHLMKIHHISGPALLDEVEACLAKTSGNLTPNLNSERLEQSPDKDILDQPLDFSIKIKTERINQIVKPNVETESLDSLDDSTASTEDADLNAKADAIMNSVNLQCIVCQKTFSTKGNLRVHVNIHMNARQFSCEVCGKRFNQKSYIKLHMQKVHNMEVKRLRRGRKSAAKSSSDVSSQSVESSDTRDSAGSPISSHDQNSN